MKASVSEYLWLVLGLVFLLAGFVLITILFVSIKPYDQIAFASTEKMRAAMNEACFTEGNVDISFNLPQNTPVLGTVFRSFPIWLIRANGDPNYVLYYESYPPGEAVGWEARLDFNNRLVIALPKEMIGGNIETVKTYINDQKKKFEREHPGEIVDQVIVSNLLLSDQFRGYEVYSAESSVKDQPSDQQTQDQQSKLFTFGVWDDPLNPRTFKFTNYLGLGIEEKSAIKYLSCGENNLCLKTRDGVYTFPLDQCEDKIKTIQFVYDARNRGTKYLVAAGLVGTGALICAFASPVCIFIVKAASFIGKFIGALTSAAWTIYGIASSIPIAGTAANVYLGYTGYQATTALASDFLAYKTSDFNLASPCNIESMSIAFVDCQDPVKQEYRVEGINLGAPFSYPVCGDGGLLGDTGFLGNYPNYVESRLLKFNKDGKLEGDGVHLTCVERIDDGTIDISQVFSPESKCLRITVDERPKGFCWTADLFKKGSWGNADSNWLVSKGLGTTPVKEHTKMIDLKTIELLPATKSLESFIANFKERVSWGWP